MNFMGAMTNRAVFNEALLPEGESRVGVFGAGFVLEVAVLLALIVIPMLVPQRLTLEQQKYWITQIEAPVVEAWKPQPKPKPVPVKQPVAKAPPKIEVAVAPPKPKIYNPVIVAPVAKRATSRNDTKAPELPQVAKVFPAPASMGSSAIPTLKKPREAVQTGGFGDPNGVKTNNQTNRNPNIAQLGAYDMPAGPGYGNGTGGAKGARGIVASTGFGNGVATGGRGGNHGTIQSGGFADEGAVAPTAKTRPTQTVARTTPVQILFKPRPVYTQEALEKKIEGEVLLQVVFTASGQVEVQRVVQGLGYGLESSAESAAHQIRFRPAQQDGHPVDSAAIVHIVFELAY